MAQLKPRERLQPSLLDRLRDDEPDKRQESPGSRMLTIEQLREGVKRELSALFNTTSLDVVEDLDDFPFAKASTLNFGLPDLCGKTVSGVDRARVERMIALAIQQFEPRLMTGTVKVTSAELASKDHEINSLVFDIHADLWAQPLPQKLLLRTVVDLENGEARVDEATG